MRRQELEAVFVGPIPQAGLHKIVFQADAPNTELIEDTDILGSTVIFLTCSYLGQRFIKIGYYVNNEYDLPEMNENPPAVVDIARVMRNILADSPRVTRWSDINWDLDAAAAPMQPMDQPGAMHVDPMGATTAPMDTQTAPMMGGEHVMAA
eukprot:COSAG04_NODE_11_length_42922_cov_38.819700_19_plen_151_part_00